MVKLTFVLVLCRNTNASCIEAYIEANAYICTATSVSRELIREAGIAKSGGECNCGCSETVPWHAVTPGWLAAQWERGSPTVRVIGMLKYCSVTVRGENKEAVERIEREHVLFPGCETQWEGETKGELYRPNKTCVTAWGAVTCISSISSTGDTSSVSVRDVTVSVKLLVLFILQHKSARAEKKSQSCSAFSTSSDTENRDLVTV